MAEQTAAPADAEAEPPAKKPRLEEEADDFDALMGGGPGGDDDLDALVGGLETGPPAEPAEEVARRRFADRLAKADGPMTEEDLESLLLILRDEAPKWGAVRRWRSSALLLVHVSRAPRAVRAQFAAEGMPLLGAVLQESVGHLETGDATARQEAGMMTLASLMALRALPIGRATMWEHRQSVGKAFDRLHRWCGKERSALAAELRAPTTELCKRWRKQPKPANQESSQEQKAIRMKVITIIQQGLLGIAGGNSPASPAPVPPSPGRLAPNTVAAEVEAALFGHHNGATNEYRQHARALRSNLSLTSNTRLREKVMSGEMGPEELVKMDSNSLAPEELQEKRKDAEKRAMKEVVAETLVPLTRLMSNSDDRLSYNPGMAPPPMVSPTREISADSIGKEKDAEAAPPASAAPVSMVPPPTPFRHGDGMPPPANVPGTERMPATTPEVMATPCPEDEDEECAALIRFLSRPVQ
eukprot:TRINITY_DN21386_c0_g1_i3.p1 TRINITY_DN21386_c0_g1~~TRINITY_DN21386_c0_g1_i3.p1  ORF type:complete len:471 (-),score=107.97 TRINITY_DN21386_c0_g1_i3:199-1611(-)